MTNPSTERVKLGKTANVNKGSTFHIRLAFSQPLLTLYYTDPSSSVVYTLRSVTISGFQDVKHKYKKVQVLQ